MIPEILVIRDLDGNEVATITRKGTKFTVELDTENYIIETKEKP